MPRQAPYQFMHIINMLILFVNTFFVFIYEQYNSLFFLPLSHPMKPDIPVQWLQLLLKTPIPPFLKKRLAFEIVKNFLFSVYPYKTKAKRSRCQHHIFQHTATIFYKCICISISQNQHNNWSTIIRITLSSAIELLHPLGVMFLIRQ